MSEAEQTEPGKIRIFDTTLRDGEESPGATMTPEDRLRIAEMLAEAQGRLHRSGVPRRFGDHRLQRRSDRAAVRSTSIAAVARCTYGDIEAAAPHWHDAAAPRIHVVVATSDLHLSKKLRITREAALERVTESVRFARRFTDDIEFSAEDASRSDLDFVCEVFAAAIRPARRRSASPTRSDTRRPTT